MTTRLLILIFVFNTLLPSIGFSAMLSSNAMSDTDTHTMMMASMSSSMTDHCASMSQDSQCDSDTMDSDLCKAQCAASLASAPANISTLSFIFPFSVHKGEASIFLSRLPNRTISPELRPPLV